MSNTTIAKNEEIHILEETTKIVSSVIPPRVIEKTKKIIVTHYLQHNKIPSQALLSKKVGLPIPKIANTLKQLHTEDFLVKRGTRYTLGDNVPTAYNMESTGAKLKAMARLSPGMLLLKLILLCIGVGATYMSIHHSTGFLQEYYTVPRALGSAIIMIVFNIISADLIVFFYMKKHWGLCVLFSFLLLGGTLFSMGSTVVGLYNKNARDLEAVTLSENADNLVNSKINLKLENIKERKVQALSDLTSETNKRDILVESLSVYTPDMIKENQETYDVMNWTRYQADKRVDEVREDYNSILEEEKKFLLTEEVVLDDVEQELPPTAYTWLAVTWGMDADKIQFMMSCYPAIFYDIISPVAFAIVLFTNNKPKKKTVKRKKLRKGKGRK